MSSQVSETDVVLKSLLRTVAKVRLDAKCIGHESEVCEVEKAITKINKLLTEKDMTKATQTSEGRNCIRSLNELICEVDDMFDHLLALQHQGRVKPSKTIKNFLTRSSSSSFSSKEVNHVRNKWKKVYEALKELDAAGDSQTDSLNTEETFSQLYVPAVIGRKEDVKCVLDMILPSAGGKTSFVCIVGIGGLGKTTLAQLVFNDPEVAAAFPLRIWVFVGRHFNFDHIEDKIVTLVKKRRWNTRFLVVLDDLWCDDENELKKLRQLVKGFRTGSCVLSTTRSRKTADLMTDTGHGYELKGLSSDDSWHLLQTTAFDRGEEPDSQLIEIGRKISAQCCYVPLALRVIGSLLYSQDLRKWLALSTTFDKTIYGSSDLLSAIKLSYDILESPLKWCFSFCALFPKGYVICRELLISLWIAHGYVEPSPITGESTEEIAEGYFNNLLQNSFFQDIKRDGYGDVVSCSVHGLMHELAQQLVGEQIRVVQSLASVTEKSCHVYHDRKEDSRASFGKMSIRTYLQSDFGGKFPVSTLLENCRSLRALSLHNLDDSSLPETIGKLLHLRYLDLSKNENLQTLPKSLTKLCNLETLDLRDCSSLTELPSDLSSLMLRRLDISGCTSLTCMPPDMKNFKCLRTLTLFVMDKGDLGPKLEDLEALQSLKGSIEILFPEKYTVPAECENQTKCLAGKTDLKAVCINFRESDTNADMQIAVLEKLQPHENLQGLTLKGYLGHEFHLTNHLVKLVKLKLRSCKGLINLPFIDKLIFLKSLILDDLENLEYVQKASTIVSSKLDDNKIFPSLEHLEISGLPKFQNWWESSGSHDNNLVSRQFPHVHHLVIKSCPVLASFPLCPAVEKLRLMQLNGNFSIHALNPGGELNLNELETDDIDYLRTKPGIRCIIKSKFLKIRGPAGGQSEQRTSSASDNDEPWNLVKDSLRNLELESMEMERLPKRMDLLTGLQHVTISGCKSLMEIPEWISSWASLKTLCIRDCTGINKFPESMRKLTSLQHLDVEGYPHLQKRCEAIHGDDWPKLLHIRTINS